MAWKSDWDAVFRTNAANKHTLRDTTETYSSSPLLLQVALSLFIAEDEGMETS